jgi:hypothetical protein
MSIKIRLLTIFLISASIAAAQTAGMTDEQTATPVPLPTTPAPSQTQKPFVPKTQSDLSIVTGNIQRPNGIAWYDNKLYTVCSGDWTLYAIDPTSGNTTQYIYGIKNAHTLYAATKDDKLSLWIPDFQSNALINIYEGVASTVASNLQGPWGITSIDAQTFGVTNLSGNSVTLITDKGEIKEVISRLRSPTGITSDDQYVYVANTGSTRRAIEWFDKSAVLKADANIDSSKSAMPLISGLQNITDLSLGSDNLLYFSYSLGTRGIVGRVDPEVCRKNGGCTSDAVEIVLYTELPSPLAGLTITPDMKLYIHSIFSPEIYWVQLEADENDTTG